MDYRILATSLHLSADIVYKHIKDELGLSRIQVELPIASSFDYRTTFYANMRDFHILCIDVSEKIYLPTRWIFISDCDRDCWPVRFFVALPSLNYPDFAREFRQASAVGVGILEIDHRTLKCHTISAALSLSLCGLRKFDKSVFQKKYRQVVAQAEETFRKGNPNDACSCIYDEIEALTRKIALRAQRKGDFTTPIADPDSLSERKPWARVVNLIDTNINRRRGICYRGLTNALLARIRGIVTYRNQSGHRPSSRRTLITRDQRLRTRMESAVDLFWELTNATKSLRL